MNSISASFNLLTKTSPKPTAEVRTPPYPSPPGRSLDLARASADSQTNFAVDLYPGSPDPYIEHTFLSLSSETASKVALNQPLS